MRQPLVVLLATVLLLTLVSGAMAQTEAEKLRQQVQQLQQQLQDVLGRLQKLETTPAQATAPTAAAQPAAPKWYDNIRFLGYMQGRFEDRRQMLSSFPPGAYPQTSTEATDEFLTRRMYFGMIAKPNERTTATVLFRHLSWAGGVDLEALNVDYKLSDTWNVEFGRVYNKYGWDAWESSSRRLPFDRFAGLEGYRPGGVRGLFFQGPTDHGIYLTHKPAPGAPGSEPTVHLGLLNGNFLNAENNNNKTYEIDLRWNRPFGQFGVSWLDGEFTENVGTPPAPMTASRQMLDLWFHSDPQPWGFQAEFVDGELFGADVRGGYAQVARNNGAGTTYFRYEKFDPTQGLPGDTFNAFRLGYAYQLDKSNELTLEYMDADRSANEVGQFGFQWQTAF